MTPALLASILLGAPVAVGALVMWLAGAPPARWAGHVAAGAVGISVYVAVTRAPRSSRSMSLAAIVAGVITIACSLCSPGLQGVHRWLDIWGVRLHASQFVMPALLVCAATRFRDSPARPQGLLLAIQGIHFLQPDAGQATSVAAASLALTVGGPSTWGSRACAAASVVIAIATWLRPDPLPAVPFVEDIVGRAFAVNRWLGCFGLAFLATATIAPIVSVRQARDPATVRAGRALSAYFVAAVLATSLGQFPVPLFGFGASSVLGAFLGLAVLRYR